MSEHGASFLELSPRDQRRVSRLKTARPATDVLTSAPFSLTAHACALTWVDRRPVKRGASRACKRLDVRACRDRHNAHEQSDRDNAHDQSERDKYPANCARWFLPINRGLVVDAHLRVIPFYLWSPRWKYAAEFLCVRSRNVKVR